MSEINFDLANKILRIIEDVKDPADAQKALNVIKKLVKSSTLLVPKTPSGVFRG